MNNNSNSSENINVSTDTEKSDFFLHREVSKGLGESIEERFRTLIEANRERPFDWYKAKGITLNKGYASLIRRGLTIPPEWLRIKIAGHFNVDSSVIWKTPDIISAAKMEEAKNVNSN